MAKTFGPTSNWGLTVEATGDQIFALPQMVKTQVEDASGNATGEKGSLRPMLHRVVANTIVNALDNQYKLACLASASHSAPA